MSVSGNLVSRSSLPLAMAVELEERTRPLDNVLRPPQPVRLKRQFFHLEDISLLSSGHNVSETGSYSERRELLMLGSRSPPFDPRATRGTNLNEHFLCEQAIVRKAMESTQAPTRPAADAKILISIGEPPKAA